MEMGEHLIGNRFRGFGSNFTAATGAKSVRNTSPEQFQIIVDLGNCADGRARGFDQIRLFDRDGRRNTANVIDARFVHALKELPHVGAESLDIATLPFGIDGVETERGFAAAARSGDDG